MPLLEGHCHLTSDQCGCVKLVVGSWSLSRFFIFSEFFSGLCLCSSSGSYSYSSSCSVLVPLLVLLPGSRLLMMRSPVLFLVALVLVLAADQKFCPKERHGESPLSPLGTSAKPSSWLLFYCKRKHLRFTRNSRATVTINETVRLANISINLNTVESTGLLVHFPKLSASASTGIHFPKLSGRNNIEIAFIYSQCGSDWKKVSTIFLFWVICNLSENRNNN